MLVGVSGERKSSSDREFTKPFRQWTLQRLEEAKPKREPLLRRGSKREGLLTKIRHLSSGGNKTAISIEADIETMKRASTRSSKAIPELFIATKPRAGSSAPHPV